MKIRKKYGDKNLIGKRTFEIRISKGIKQKDFLARIQTLGVDMNPSSLSKLEGQNRIATDKEVKAIVEILDVSYEHLMGEDTRA